jgi:hypothetical protein
MGVDMHFGRRVTWKTPSRARHTACAFPLYEYEWLPDVNPGDRADSARCGSLRYECLMVVVVNLDEVAKFPDHSRSPWHRGTAGSASPG